MEFLTQIRSSLQFYYPNDFKNLTNNELKECKWKLQLQIFSLIIFTSSNLLLYAEKLTELNDKKSLALENLRSRKDSREFKRQTEEEYRHDFLQMILEICIENNYPAVLVPFSNPLQLFYDDTEFILKTILFLLERIVEPTSNNRRPPLQSFNSSAAPPVITVSTSVPGTPSYNSTTTGEIKLTPRKSPIHKSSRQPPPPTPSSHIEDGCSREEVEIISTNKIQNMGDYQSLFQSFQILQHHNQQLTKQLKHLQDSIIARDESERNIDLLIRDIQLAVSDIAEIGAGNNLNLESSEQSSHVDESSTKNGTSNIRRDTSKQSQQSISTRRDVEKKSRPVGWLAIQNRFQELYSKWTEARRSAKSAVFSAITVHPSVASQSKYPLNRDSHTGFLKSQDDFSTSRTPTARRSNTAKSTTRAVKSAPLSRIEERSSFPTVQLSQILGISPAQSIGRSHHDTNDSFLSIAFDLSRVHLIQQDLVKFSKSAFEFTHQIRSLSLASSQTLSSSTSTLPASSSHSHIHDDSSQHPSLSLITEDISYDMNTSLQSHQSTIPIESKKLIPSHGDHSPFQINTNSLLNYEILLNSLRVQSRTLLLHLSCLAPLTPLSMGGNTNDNNIQNSVGFSMPLSSSQTGLDLFIEMMIETLEPRKLLTPAIQKVMDRSKSEQISLLNSIHECEKVTNKWMKISTESHEILKNLTKSLNDTFKETLKEIQRHQNMFLTISRSWSKCEQTRIQLPSSSSSSSYSAHSASTHLSQQQFVSPVEMLCRGYLGEDVASLMNTMKLYQHEFDQVVENLNILRKKLLKEFNLSVIHSILECYQKFSEL